MLVANRFNRTPTQATQSRLAQVLDNTIPMTLRERNRGAVVAIQSALADLNRGYLARAEVDGYFGPRMATAVEVFQRDYGLFADGIVGRQTLTELDQMFASDTFRRPQGMSIHVGVNKVDPAHYGGEHPLAACENDALAFRDIAESLGYEAILLLTQEATTANFTQAMRQAIANLFSGDALFITFSGHGSQISNTSADEESDLLDETLCFYDRMLIDDELYALLSQLRPGVQVTAVYDSCHSGTVTKKLQIALEIRAAELKPLLVRNLMTSLTPGTLADRAVETELTATESADTEQDNLFKPIRADSLAKALDGERPAFAAAPAYTGTQIDAAVEVITTIEKALDSGRERFIGFFSGVYERNRDLYNAIKNVVGSQEQIQLECTVVALSACQDNQTTADGPVNGLFTSNILSAWGNGTFDGSCSQLHRRLVGQSAAERTPMLNTYGGPQAEARLHERPFTF